MSKEQRTVGTTKVQRRLGCHGRWLRPCERLDSNCRPEMSACRGSNAMSFCLLSLMIMSGCLDFRSWTNMDSWYKGGPPGLRRMAWVELPDDAIHIVSKAKERHAEAMLSEAACLEISSEEASTLTGLSLPRLHDSRYCLVRGVYLFSKSGGFAVATDGDEKLWISHGSLGGHPTTMKRQALVVVLKTLPTTVYVTCSSAQ